MEWAEWFKGRAMSVDYGRSGRSSTVTCVEVNKEIDQRIRDNRRVNISKNASEISISYGKKQ
jgi:hypothetical protein